MARKVKQVFISILLILIFLFLVPLFSIVHASPFFFIVLFIVLSPLVKYEADLFYTESRGSVSDTAKLVFLSIVKATSITTISFIFAFRFVDILSKALYTYLPDIDNCKIHINTNPGPCPYPILGDIVLPILFFSGLLVVLTYVCAIIIARLLRKYSHSL